jgi:hypothetical protein
MKTAGLKNASFGMVVLSTLFFVSGCLPLLSMQPLYSDDTVVFEEKLLGKWYGEDQTWHFTRNGEKKYELKVVDQEGTGQFDVHLVKLQEHLFLDLYPQQCKAIENTAVIYQMGLIPVHIVLYAEPIEDQLILHLVDSKEIIESDPNAVKYVMIDDCPVITANPQQLQKALIDNFTSEDVIDEKQNIFYRGVPLYSRDDIFFSDKLPGQWESEDGTIIDSIAWENGYDIIMSHNEQDVFFKAYLVNIRQQSYLAFFADGDMEKELALYPDYLFQIEQIESKLSMLNVDLCKSMESGSIQCKQEKSQVYRKR